MDLALGGKVVLVTGASGALGRATAEAFAAEGARVAAAYREFVRRNRGLSSLAGILYPGIQFLVGTGAVRFVQVSPSARLIDALIGYATGFENVDATFGGLNGPLAAWPTPSSAGLKSSRTVSSSSSHKAARSMKPVCR